MIELRGIEKRFGSVKALDDVNLRVNPGELLALVGPSGSGKSTLLRVVAGLESPTAGEIWIDGRRADRLPPRDRDVALVFQEPVCYGHLTVAGNLEFAIRSRGVARAERARRVAEVADRLGLDRQLGRRPRDLSGGERQRVALGRALARRPALLLLDEPFSALDPPLRADLRRLLVAERRGQPGATIHVTHDPAEALAIGDRVAFLLDGRIAQIGTPQEIYDRPTRVEVARGFGNPPMNLLPGRVAIQGGSLHVQIARAEAVWPASIAPDLAVAATRPGDSLLGVRPESIRHDRPDGPALGVEGTLIRVEPAGHEAIVFLAAGPITIASRWPIARAESLQIGQTITAWIEPSALAAFDLESGTRVVAE